jgi:chromatin licensing and DNA replication factor 1
MTTPKKTTVTPRKLLMSPPSKSPTKLPAHLRFQNLAETGRSGSTLQMPYKYRNLYEMFKCLDTVCAMFFNRKEKITFKKLKPAVQRMMRKNFHETHLAQIHHLFPEAYNFTIEKTRNYGSATKHDHHQLVVVPNVDDQANKASGQLIDETDVLKVAQLSPMNPLVMIARLQKFQRMLLELVKDEHQTFLQQLDPPMVVERDQIRRWHPEFDLEKCPEVQIGELPQPPQEERFSSAQDVLSTARNLFKCNTAMERALDRLEAKKQKDKEEQKTDGTVPPTEPTANKSGDDLLKGIPKTLLEKIRAKQAAKALDTMTRRPSQEKESARYNSLPELARHLRNVFVTERKGVLQQDIVLRKVENSFRGKLTLKDLEEHLQLLSKAIPAWLSFHDVRKTIFVKLNRDLDLSKVIGKLEKLAEEKAK